MTAIATLGQWMAQMRVTARQYKRNPDGSLPTVLDGVLFQVENDQGEIILPLVEGPEGDQGPAGIPLRPRAAVSTPANLPANLNDTTDLNTVVLVGSDKTIRVWAGSAFGWVNWGSIAGPTGPSGPFRQAADYDDTLAPTAGAWVRWNGSKFAPFVLPEVAVEHTASFLVPNDSNLLSPVPMGLKVRSQGPPDLAPFIDPNVPSRVVCPMPGLYEVDGRATWPTDSGGSRVCGIRRSLSGTSPLAGSADLWIGDACLASNNIQTSVSVHAEVQVTASGWVELMAGCTRVNGFALTNSRHETQLTLRYLHP